VFAPDEARHLLDAINVTASAGVCDRALIGLMLIRSRESARR